MGIADEKKQNTFAEKFAKKRQTRADTTIPCAAKV